MSELKMLGDRIEREWIYQLEEKVRQVHVMELGNVKVITQEDFWEVCEFITRLYKQERRRKFKPLPKQSKKKPIRSYENGIKIFADGRERCMTKEAWNRRRDEVFARDERWGWVGVYDCKLGCGGEGYRHQFEVDHIIKRSLGRDDRLSNLRLLCIPCHRQRHEGFKKAITPTESSSGEGPNALSNEGEISKPNRSEFKARGAGQ